MSRNDLWKVVSTQTRFARQGASALASQPDRSDILDGGRGYIGGALTTLWHVGLLSHGEYESWFERLNAELPPTDWIGG